MPGFWVPRYDADLRAASAGLGVVLLGAARRSARDRGATGAVQYESGGGGIGREGVGRYCKLLFCNKIAIKMAKIKSLQILIKFFIKFKNS